MIPVRLRALSSSQKRGVMMVCELGAVWMYIADFIETSSKLASPQKLFELLVNAAQDEGYNQLAYGALTYREAQLAEHPSPAVTLNYPKGWQQHYVDQDYAGIDPVVTFTPRIARPFRWDNLQNRLSPRQKLMMNEANEAGLRNGLSVPLHSPSARVAVVSFASEFPEADASICVDHLNMLASLFHAAFTSITSAPQLDAPKITLSQRELDCLNWTAHGKSSWDIGMILAISENTVNFHVKNAMRKLGSTNRIVAVLKAVRLGLIGMPQF